MQSILSSVPREGIPVIMMKWKQVSTYSSNSGFLVFKEFSFHSFTIFNVKKEIDYLCMYLHDAQKNFQNDKKMNGWMDGAL